MNKAITILTIMLGLVFTQTIFGDEVTLDENIESNEPEKYTPIADLAQSILTSTGPVQQHAIETALEIVQNTDSYYSFESHDIFQSLYIDKTDLLIDSLRTSYLPLVVKDIDPWNKEISADLIWKNIQRGRWQRDHQYYRSILSLAFTTYGHQILAYLGQKYFEEGSLVRACDYLDKAVNLSTGFYLYSTSSHEIRSEQYKSRIQNLSASCHAYLEASYGEAQVQPSKEQIQQMAAAELSNNFYDYSPEKPIHDINQIIEKQICLRDLCFSIDNHTFIDDPIVFHNLMYTLSIESQSSRLYLNTFDFVSGDLYNQVELTSEDLIKLGKKDTALFLHITRIRDKIYLLHPEYLATFDLHGRMIRIGKFTDLYRDFFDQYTKSHPDFVQQRTSKLNRFNFASNKLETNLMLFLKPQKNSPIEFDLTRLVSLKNSTIKSNNADFPNFNRTFDQFLKIGSDQDIFIFYYLKALQKNEYSNKVDLKYLFQSTFHQNDKIRSLAYDTLQFFDYKSEDQDNFQFRLGLIQKGLKDDSFMVRLSALKALRFNLESSQTNSFGIQALHLLEKIIFNVNYDFHLRAMAAGYLISSMQRILQPTIFPYSEEWLNYDLDGVVEKFMLQPDFLAFISYYKRMLQIYTDNLILLDQYRFLGPTEIAQTLGYFSNPLANDIFNHFSVASNEQLEKPKSMFNYFINIFSEILTHSDLNEFNNFIATANQNISNQNFTIGFSDSLYSYLTKKNIEIPLEFGRPIFEYALSLINSDNFEIQDHAENILFSLLKNETVQVKISWNQIKMLLNRCQLACKNETIKRIIGMSVQRFTENNSLKLVVSYLEQDDITTIQRDLIIWGLAIWAIKNNQMWHLQEIFTWALNHGDDRRILVQLGLGAQLYYAANTPDLDLSPQQLQQLIRPLSFSIPQKFKFYAIAILAKQLSQLNDPIKAENIAQFIIRNERFIPIKGEVKSILYEITSEKLGSLINAETLIKLNLISQQIKIKAGFLVKIKKGLNKSERNIYLSLFNSEGQLVCPADPFEFVWP